MDEHIDDISDHGGSLAPAAALFPDAPTPWLDLSTGINPHAYPLTDLPADAFTRLPEAADVAELNTIAAACYGAPSPRMVVAAPGTQILLPLVMELAGQGRAAVLSPTYAEHARAARLVGHGVSEVTDVARLFDADLAIVVNPNNPDGRVIERDMLLDLARHLHRKGGLLVVDEAFMEVGPRDRSVAGNVGQGGLVVLRSFGKFFGLAGVRLGFALAAEPVASKLRSRLGPWAVAGPALAYGRMALADMDWQARMRQRLAHDASRLDALLLQSGLTVAGGTSLYRFVRTPHAPSIYDQLGRNGILVRNFDAMDDALRFGLPGDDAAFDRLAASLTRWRDRSAI
ncbi:threonine-phosphate decarboxylase CobD [Mesorhizobium sp. CAU 1732]|uniref:threonine-phosphate decarboxylase CobD n=1 Tax=Mesorhizobium sp. CAU 1732 TaxID=3140358 RepID=UPI0032611A5F